MGLIHYRLSIGDDDLKRRKLIIKHRQYQERLETIELCRHKLTEEQFSDLAREYIIRMRIINRLLETGSVEFSEIERQLILDGLTTKEDMRYIHAALVIIDYVVADGINLTGGQGWPDIKARHRY